MSAHTLLDACLWLISALWVIEQIVRATRVKAPKHNRVLPAPSPLCERTPKFEVSMQDTVFAARQAD
jgi:hypothetical protein